MKKKKGDTKGTTLTKIELKEKNLIIVDDQGRQLGATLHEHKVGRRVKIVGMKSMPELEDKFATIDSWNDRNDRWKVVMERDKSERYEMKQKNLVVVDEYGNEV